MFANTGLELLEACIEQNCTLWEYTLKAEIENSGLNQEQVFEKKRKTLHCYA
jgi:L-serine dehydratase